MNDEPMRISEKGMALAVEILAQQGYLDEMEPSDNFVENFIKIKAACDKYIEASIAKGDTRSHEECRDAIMIGYFHAYLQDVTRNVN